MERVDLRDKLFHGIIPYEQNNQQHVVNKLQSIICSKKLYCRKSIPTGSFLPFNYDEFYNDETEVCLAAYPNIGKYSFTHGKTLPIDAYGCFAERLALMFNESLFKDFEIRKGLLDNEYYLTGDIDLDKYLVGIKRAGLEVKGNLKILYYFFKYYNHEITLDDFLVYSGLGLSPYNKETYDLKNIPNIAEIVNCQHWAEYLYHRGQYEIEFAVNPPEYYIEESPVFDQVKLLADMNSIKMYDLNGVRVTDKEARREEIKQMIEYLLEQLDKTEDERIPYLIKKYNAKPLNSKH